MISGVDRFFDCDQTLVLSNPASNVEEGIILNACDELDIAGNVILPTSGTTGRSRWVILSRDALKGSARAVNAHLEIRSDDIWICALPVFHAGGLAIHVRARESGSEVVEYSTGWDPRHFVQRCDECRATLCSLVPTQLFDLVELSLSAPSQLRVLLVGGAALDARLRDQAIALGWPVHETYGMTEAGSQIATQRNGQPGMELLDCWNARLGNSSTLEIRGKNIFSGYLQENSGCWRLINPTDEEGWFSTGDRMVLSGSILKVLGREDSMIKILGERVELDVIQARLESIAGTGIAVSAIPDSRRGYKLILVAEQGVNLDEVSHQYNQVSPGPERLAGGFLIKAIPRTTLGKLCRGELNEIIHAHAHAHALRST